MNNNRKEKINQITEETLVVGINVAKNRHVARAQNFRGIEYGNPIYFYNREDGFERLKHWISNLAHQKNNDWFRTYRTLLVTPVQIFNFKWIPCTTFSKEISGKCLV